jgi:hypothetical protein
MSAAIVPSGLPEISSARLPATYEHARQALAECSRIDECQEWADKAEALASYAKQAKDDQLRKLADRIQARAIRRCGELLKQIEPGVNRFDRREGDLPANRTEAAEQAGLSEHQRKTALRVASVPAEDFERQVDSDEPPTVTALAEQGKKPLLNLGDTSPADFRMATEAIASLRRFAEFARTHDPARVAAGVDPREVKNVRRYVADIDSWLDRFITTVEG